MSHRCPAQGEPLRMGSTHFYYSKERWKCTFYLGLSRAKQTVKEEAIPYTKDTQCTMLEATSGDVVQLLKIMSELHSKVRI